MLISLYPRADTYILTPYNTTPLKLFSVRTQVDPGEEPYVYGISVKTNSALHLRHPLNQPTICHTEHIYVLKTDSSFCTAKGKGNPPSPLAAVLSKVNTRIPTGPASPSLPGYVALKFFHTYGHLLHLVS